MKTNRTSYTTTDKRHNNCAITRLVFTFELGLHRQVVEQLEFELPSKNTAGGHSHNRSIAYGNSDGWQGIE